jgi:ribosomal-protein-alanine N-acetyltransferase
MLTINLNGLERLETEGLVLRKMNADDVDALFAIRTNDDVLHFIQKEKASSKSAMVELIENINKNWEENNAITWAITQKPNDVLIGSIGFWRIDKENHRAEIGYALHPDYHQRGIMQEALKKVITIGFDELYIHSIEANILPENIASKKLLTNAGFVQEAHFKENYYFNGGFYDSVILSLVK